MALPDDPRHFEVKTRFNIIQGVDSQISKQISKLTDTQMSKPMLTGGRKV